MTYTITVVMDDGTQSVIQCSSETYLLDAFEENFLDAPYSCKAGACSTCAGKVTTGEVDQEEQSYLDDDQMQEGYCLTCVSYPKSDLTVHLRQEENLY